MGVQSLIDEAVTTAVRLGVDDAVGLGSGYSTRMLRFANDSVSVVNRVEETELTLYLARGGRRAIASTINLDGASVRKFTKELHSTLGHLPESEYAPLPRKAEKFLPGAFSFDKRLLEVEDHLPEFAKDAIDAARAAGAKRSAGVIELGAANYAIRTSTGTRGVDRRTSITLNIRSFGDHESSGHGLSCSSSLGGFDPRKAGERAGSGAKEMGLAREPEGGKYEVLLGPAVASNLIETVADAASAFSVDSGTSFLTGMLGKQVASQSFNLTDHGVIEGGLGGRVFDDEGVRTGTTTLIQGGVLRTYLHNLTTAKKWKTSSNGHAGLVAPHPWNLEVGHGDSGYDEMVREIKHGIVLTSNWYTRFMNYRTGEFSTVPRDLAYLVEGGEVRGTLKDMRLSDSLTRLLSSVKLVSKDRDWIEWWEVETPTLCPWILAEGTKITRAYD